jgi:mucin-like protein
MERAITGRCVVLLLMLNALPNPGVAQVIPTDRMERQKAAWENCKKELNFTANFPAGSCFGANTVIANPTLDGSTSFNRLGYVKLAEQVDALFHCGRVDPVKKTIKDLEMFIHNRQSGKTCAFEADIRGPSDSTEGPAFFDPFPYEFPEILGKITFPIEQPGGFKVPDNKPYWIENPRKCVRCHTSGSPFLAGKFTSPGMAFFGQLNNGHDTRGTRFAYVALDPVAKAEVNTAVADDLKTKESCALGCHSLAINNSYAYNVAQELDDLMPPHSATNHFRWVNLDTPTDGVEREDMVKLAQIFDRTTQSSQTLWCANPVRLEARVQASDYVYATNSTPDRLNKFNLQDGLVCVNADQPGGKCNDYRVRFQCGSTWTDWINADSPNDSGDHETMANIRRAVPGLCANPTEIEAGFVLNGNLYAAYGPRDRLRQFDPAGIQCNDADQTNGKCSNYVARFTCGSWPSEATPLARNVNTGNVGTEAKTYVVSSTVSGWSAWNLAGRTVEVNGQTVTAGQMPLPPAVDGKYYFTFTPGGLPYAGMTFW